MNKKSADFFFIILMKHSVQLTHWIDSLCKWIKISKSKKLEIGNRFNGGLSLIYQPISSRPSDFTLRKRNLTKWPRFKSAIWLKKCLNAMNIFCKIEFQPRNRKMFGFEIFSMSNEKLSKSISFTSKSSPLLIIYKRHEYSQPVSQQCLVLRKLVFTSYKNGINQAKFQP